MQEKGEEVVDLIVEENGIELEEKTAFLSEKNQDEVDGEEYDEQLVEVSDVKVEEPPKSKFPVGMGW
jgi:hypothetical protein